MAAEAISSLKDRTGSSRQKIRDTIIASNPKLNFQSHYLNAALKKAVEGGKLVQVKASYKLAAKAKAAPKKAAPKKKPAAKKATKVSSLREHWTALIPLFNFEIQNCNALYSGDSHDFPDVVVQHELILLLFASASSQKAAPKKAAPKKAAPKKAAKKAAPKKKAAAKK